MFFLGFVIACSLWHFLFHNPFLWNFLEGLSILLLFGLKETPEALTYNLFYLYKFTYYSYGTNPHNTIHASNHAQVIVSIVSTSEPCV